MTSSTLVRTAPRRRWTATLATTAWASVVLLVMIGSIVRVSGHGLGCPDWPLCYGRAIPPGLASAWVEFSHRLFGGITSLQVVLLAVFAWRGHRDRPWVLRPMLLAVGLLVIQIALGGLHVILEIPPETGLAHTATALLLVGTLAVVLAGASGFGQRLEQAAQQDSIHGSLPALAALATYALLLTGSTVTRSGASLACLSFPACGAVERATRQLIEIQMLHRYAAFTVAAFTLVTVYWMLRRTSRTPLRTLGYAILGLLALQITLGILNVALRLPAGIRVLHLTIGATFWSAMVVLWRVTRRTGGTAT